MSDDRIRKIAIAGVLGGISAFLGITRLGFITIPGFTSLTIMHVPIIIGAILEGPMVGMGIGLIFGVSSMLQAAIAPGGVSDTWFTNPLLAVLPRLAIGPVAWWVWQSLEKHWPIPGMILAALAGSFTNTVLALGLIGLFRYSPWEGLLLPLVVNGPLEAIGAAIITVAVVAAWKRIAVGQEGANLD